MLFMTDVMRNILSSFVNFIFLFG